jgi:N-methylhydantoinase B/oxoprolinase/acetone carboxylase alpha subunit
MLPNTCGFGKYRGGVGAAIAYVTQYVPYTVWTSTQKESKIPTHAGLFGAYSETVVPSIRVTGTNVLEKLRAGVDDIPSNDLELVMNNTLGGDLVLEHQTRMATIMHKGELITSSTQGGGGYGDVLEREPRAVAKDLREGIITDWVARNIFKVAYEAQTFVVDEAETERLRVEERETRKARGKSWDEFHAEWSRLRPPDDVLKYYGTWPDAEKNRDIIRV